jgi:hypothetical protein
MLNANLLRLFKDIDGYFFGFQLVKVIYYCIKICIMDEKQMCWYQWFSFLINNYSVAELIVLPQVVVAKLIVLPQVVMANK